MERFHGQRSALRGRTLAAVTAAGLAAGAVLVGATWAAAQQDDEQLRGCAGTSGALRLLETAEQCRSNERTVTWSVRGPVGPPGPEGPKGDKGDKGDAGGAPGSTPPATVGYLRLGTIQGDSTRAGFVDQVEVLSYSFGASNSGSTHAGGGAGAGRTSIQDLAISKLTDRASVPLLNAVAVGRHLPQAVLTVCVDAACDPATNLVLTLEDVLVTSLSQGGGAPATEQITLNFARIDYARGGQRTSYDVVENRAG